MRLALFDLDHTLIPFDSGMAWVRVLVGRELLPPDATDTYLAYCKDYVAGAIDVRDLHRALVLPLAGSKRGAFDGWLADFEAGLGASLPAPSLALVTMHRAAGDRCVLVTATARFVAERYAAAFGIADVIATESARDSYGRLTGEIVGPPCAREHKLDKLAGWLALEGLRLDGFERTWFYSDSAGDLPLLRAVSDPVAVRPDAALRAVAEQEGWRIEMLEAA